MKHNKVQEDCSGEPDLVVGEIYGLRQWQLHDPATNPYLVGHFSMAWDLNAANVAECRVESEWVESTFSLKPDASGPTPGKAVAYYAHAFFEQYPDAPSLQLSLIGSRYPVTRMNILRSSVQDRENLPDIPLIWAPKVVDGFWTVHEMLLSESRPLDFRLRAENPTPPHAPTYPECRCGFYAYTDEKSLRSNSRTYGDTVFGLVRAYGLVTQGTKGFRAQKAEVVALTKPHSAVNTRPDYQSLLAPRKAAWIPNTEETITSGFQRMVPDHIAVLETLDDLITLASHFLEPLDT